MAIQFIIIVTTQMFNLSPSEYQKKNLCRSAAVSEDDPNNVILSTEAGAPASLLFHKNITPHHLKPSIVEHINHEPPRCDHNDRPWVRTSSASEHRRGHIK